VVLAYHPSVKFFQAKSSFEIIDLVQRNRVDMLFMDFHIRGLGGIETSRKIRGLGNDVKIIITTTKDDRSLIMRMIRAGVNGYVFKSIDKFQLENAIESVLDGRFYFSEGSAVEENDEKGILNNAPSTLTERLNPIEIDILLLICEQVDLSGIAKITGLDEATVNSNIDSIMKKTRTNNLIGLALYAVSHGFVKSDK
jgi:DNA-binding NarL/FixJ family response regulator